MKIAVIYCGSHRAAWSVADGLVSTLGRMGHQVLPLVRGRPGLTPRITVTVLNQADLILVSGPEHMFQVERPRAEEYKFLNEHEITLYEWKHEVKVPKAFWYLESNSREDTNFQMQECLPYADHHFFSAIQDAEFFDQEHMAKGRSHWLPFGVDTEVFKPLRCPSCLGKGLKVLKVFERAPAGNLTEKGMDGGKCKECLGAGFVPTPKDIEVGFVGNFYQKRIAFLQRLVEHLKEGPQLSAGQVHVQDIDGIPWLEMAHRLAANYRRCAIFLNLPTLSRLLVTKVWEVLACGVFCFTPILDGEAEANMQSFENAKHLAYYAPENLPFLVQNLRKFVENDKMRETIAFNGLYEVRTKHTLEIRMQQILGTMFKAQPFVEPTEGLPEISGVSQ